MHPNAASRSRVVDPHAQYIEIDELGQMPCFRRRPGRRQMHKNTFVRWVKNGHKARNGQRIKLPARKVAGRGLCTTEAELQAFLEAFAAAEAGDATTTPPAAPPPAPAKPEGPEKPAAKPVGAVPAADVAKVMRRLGVPASPNGVSK